MKDLLNNKLTDKQIAFCLEYLKDYNATQAAIRVGYSKKSARQQAQRMLTKDDINKYIKELQTKVENEKIMNIKEIQERLTLIARGDAEEDVVIVENTGGYSSEARVLQKKVSAKEQVKALELLGKANALFVDTVKSDVNIENRSSQFDRYMEELKNGRTVKKSETKTKAD